MSPSCTQWRICNVRRTVLRLGGMRSGPRSKQLRERDQPADDQQAADRIGDDDNPIAGALVPLLFCISPCIPSEGWVAVTHPIRVLQIERTPADWWGRRRWNLQNVSRNFSAVDRNPVVCR